MKKRRIAYLTLFLMSITIVPLHADMKKLGQAGFKFLDVEVGARATGMGEAFTVIGSGAEAIFHNPAGIAQMGDKKFDVIVSRTDWIADTYSDAVGLVYNLGVWGQIGISALNTEFGTSYGTRIDRTSSVGYVETGELHLAAYAGGLAYSRMLTEKFMLGVSARYAGERLGNSRFMNDAGDSTWSSNNFTSTATFDAGTIFYPGIGSLRIGMAIKNFSTQVTYEEDAFQLPLTFHVGIGMDILDLLAGEHPDRSLWVDFEAVHPRDYDKRFHIGAEFTYMDMFSVRLGYKGNYSEEGLCAGVGIQYNGVRIDYSYVDFGRFDFVNRISAGFSM